MRMALELLWNSRIYLLTSFGNCLKASRIFLCSINSDWRRFISEHY